jgi:ferritin-like metal-binding protein YciE
MEKPNHKTDNKTAVKKTPALYKDEANSFIDELKKNYHFEKILNKALPEMIENETREELIEGLTKHLIFTNEHLVRLKEFLYSIGETEIVKKHEAMYGENKLEEEQPKS